MFLVVLLYFVFFYPLSDFWSHSTDALVTMNSYRATNMQGHLIYCMRSADVSFVRFVETQNFASQGQAYWRCLTIGDATFYFSMG